MFKLGWFIAVATLFAGSGIVYFDTVKKVADKEAVVTRGRALKNFVDEDWGAAEAQFRKAISSNENDSHAWFMMAFAQHYQGKYGLARENFLKAEKLGACKKLVHYNLACGYALEGDSKSALKELNRAVELNFNMYEHAKEDPDLDSLRDLPEFKKIMERLERKVAPAPPKPPKEPLAPNVP
ncbi:hypothetical protein QPK87_05500 [Kamptonema cortianum]|nr:hypothetical protein [Geitlerinema splendidum]MDK3156032.1 hypothetical protein [Kamptonema cortianum]